MLIESLEKRGAIAMLNDDRRAAVVRAAGELLDSNIAMRALQVGEAMPDFTLHAATDQLVRLSEVLPAAQPWSASSGVPGASIASPSSVHSPTRTIRSAQPVPEVLALSPQREELEGTRALPFPWLRDDDNLVARKVGVAFELPRDLSWAYRELGIDLPKLNQSDRFELPVPATFVVGKDQRIRFAHVEPDYRRRPTVHEVLRAVEEATKTSELFR